MSVFRLPSSISNELSGMSGHFWWGRRKGKRGIHWLKWSSLCRNKLKGGLGFRDYVDFNQALVAKQCWRLLTSPNLLISQVFKGCYYPHSTFLSAPVVGKKLLIKGLRWRVGDGRSIHIYNDPWLPTPSSFRIMSTPNMPITSTVSDLITPAGNWHLELISHSFWNVEAAAICSIPLPLSPAPDKICWHYIKQAVYMVKSGYQVTQDAHARDLGGEGSSNGLEDGIWKVLWNLKISSAAKVFLWRSLHDILPTAANLHWRHLLHSPICSRCKLASETTLHALWTCPKAKEVWVLTSYQLVVGSWHQGRFVDLFRAAVSALSKTELSFAVVLCQRIWQARNEELFQQKFVTAQYQISQVHSFISDFLLATTVIPKSGAAPVQSHWSRPCLPFLKLNVDGAVDVLTGRRGLGAVLRNENGELMLAVSKGLMGGFGPKVTELYAAALGLQTISQAGFQNSHIILEMDALLAVNDFKEEEPNWSSEGALIEEVKALFHLLPLVMCTYCPRKCNQAAHSLDAAELAASLDEKVKNDLPLPGQVDFINGGPSQHVCF